MTLLIFILILGLLVLVHELGHFLVAKRNGITAHEFGFGIPPRILGVYKNDKGKLKVVFGGKHVKAKGTIYSLNLFPVGGFVKIKGEEGNDADQPDSFAGKSAWIKSKVLLAGIAMNFILAWLLLSVVFMKGSDEEVGVGEYPSARIIIMGIEKGSPADNMGLRLGDEIISGRKEQKVSLNEVSEVQNFISSNKGSEIVFNIKRAGSEIELKGIPRTEVAQGQGLLGINLAKVAFVRHSFFESLYLGLIEIKSILIMMLVFLKDLIFGKVEGTAVTGVIGIGFMTGEIVPLGINALLRFIAMLSLNLGIINALPIPALDGGRVLFVIIEKIKGSPVSQRLEQAFHAAGFLFIFLLMIVVTYMDIVRYRYDLLGWFKNLF